MCASFLSRPWNSVRTACGASAQSQTDWQSQLTDATCGFPTRGLAQQTKKYVHANIIPALQNSIPIFKLKNSNIMNVQTMEGKLHSAPEYSQFKLQTTHQPKITKQKSTIGSHFHFETFQREREGKLIFIDPNATWRRRLYYKEALKCQGRPQRPDPYAGLISIKAGTCNASCNKGERLLTVNILILFTEMIECDCRKLTCRKTWMHSTARSSWPYFCPMTQSYWYHHFESWDADPVLESFNDRR